MSAMPYMPILLGALRVANNLLKVAISFEKDNPTILEVLTTLERVLGVAISDLESHQPEHKPEHKTLAENDQPLDDDPDNEPDAAA